MDYLFSLMVFTFVASVTPGPNNLMLFASGIHHGVRRSLPHYFGICVGFLALVACVGFGLGTLFTQSPVLHKVLQIAGALYLLYFAWKVGSANPATQNAEQRRPIRFIEAALFQWVNPKAWVIAVGAISAFTISDKIVASILSIIAMYFVMGSLAMGLWLKLGASLQRFMNSQKKVRVFNITMGLLLALSILPIVFLQVPS